MSASVRSVAGEVVPATHQREVAGGWALVVAAQRGDRDAFGRLYER